MVFAVAAEGKCSYKNMRPPVQSRYLLTVLAVLALMTVSQRSSLAFSSFEIFGGAYHKRLTEDALRPFGFSAEPLKYINQGLLEPDKFYRRTFTDGSVHFTEMDFEGSVGFLNERFRLLVETAGECPDDYQSYRETLTLLGGYLHTSQDFYAHSNWVERVVVGGGQKIPLVDMREAKEFEELVCPYFLYTAFPPSEIVNISKHQKRFGREFYSEAELAVLSPSQRIRLTAEPEKALIHRSLAKDDPDYPQSQLRWTTNGPTLFELAYDAGVRDTQVRWKELSRQIKLVHGEREEAIIALLQNGWTSDMPPEQTGRSHQGLRLTKAEVEVDRNLELRVELEIKPKHWNRLAGNKAVELFRSLTSEQVAGQNQGRRGLQSLSFQKNEKSETFDFHMRADLYGGSQTFLLLTPHSDDPEGSWELSIELPKDLLSSPGLAIISSSANRRIGPRHFLLEPPTQGWSLPIWIKEYIEDALYRPEKKFLLDPN